MQTPDNQNDRVWLTPLLNRIANVAGENAAIALGRARAGERIYIPERMTADHWLAELVGLEAASKISAAFGSQKMEIPQSVAGDKRRRAAAIADLIDRGYSTNAIARTLGISQNTVAEHRRKRPVVDPQLKLL